MAKTGPSRPERRIPTPDRSSQELAHIVHHTSSRRHRRRVATAQQQPSVAVPPSTAARTPAPLRPTRRGSTRVAKIKPDRKKRFVRPQLSPGVRRYTDYIVHTIRERRAPAAARYRIFWTRQSRDVGRRAVVNSHVVIHSNLHLRTS